MKFSIRKCYLCAAIMTTLYTIKSRLNHFINARHRKGHWVHSPYLFRFINQVLFEKNKYYCFNTLKKIRNNLANDNSIFSSSATDKQQTEGQKKVKSLIKKCNKREKQSQLLHRICVDANAKTILEIGTKLGIDTLYMASCNKKLTTVYTLEESKHIAQIARKNFKSLNFDNIKVIEGNINHSLKETIDNLSNIDVVFFNENQSYEETINYFNICKNNVHNKTIFIINGIHDNREMGEAWNAIQKCSRVSTTIDIYYMGLVWFDPYLPKHNLIIPF